MRVDIFGTEKCKVTFGLKYIFIFKCQRNNFQFEKNQNTGSRSFLDRTAEVPCLSRSTVDRVGKEKKESGMFLSQKEIVGRTSR